MRNFDFLFLLHGRLFFLRRLGSSDPTTICSLLAPCRRPILRRRRPRRCRVSRWVAFRGAFAAPKEVFYEPDPVSFSLFFLRRCDRFALRKSITATSQSTLIIRRRTKSDWPSRGPANTGKSMLQDLDRTRFISLLRHRKCFRARFKTFGQNSRI
jgi:hypothetical protein